jgi:hypothetical protein
LTKVVAEQKAWKKPSPEERSDPRKVMAWKGRAEGLTTRLERDYLNVRRANARPEKERRRIEEEKKLYKKLDLRDAALARAQAGQQEVRA